MGRVASTVSCRRRPQRRDDWLDLVFVLRGCDPESVGLGHRREIQADDSSANDHRAGDDL